MSIVIRDALEEDAEAIAQVHVRSWRETYREILNPETLTGLSVEERVKMWRSAFAQPNPRAKLLVAEALNGEVVGFIRGGPVRSNGPLAAEAEIFAVYLIDKAKRQGVGTRLMAGVFDHLRDQGFRSAGLWVVKDNLPARRFYERLGGQPGPEQTFDLNGQQVTEMAYRFEPIPQIR